MCSPEICIFNDNPSDSDASDLQTTLQEIYKLEVILCVFITLHFCQRNGYSLFHILSLRYG